ncbi:conserved hypothetical protein [Ricinus communis]|uniref:Uncharacterized protein n=1 Tax=Ricinus communis TaxID=3988 RepID=B9RVH5_RICCO|nr:conserved hypothetical protein [Ricinus communis]
MHLPIPSASHDLGFGHDNYPTAPQIPMDLFISKKHPDLAHGELGFADSSGNLVFRTKYISSKRCSSSKWVILDKSRNPIISIYRQKNGYWHGFKGDSEGENQMTFKVQRTLNKIFRTELEVFLVKENSGESASDFKIKGCAFQRSCIIYGGDAIVAQV